MKLGSFCKIFGLFSVIVCLYFAYEFYAQQFRLENIVLPISIAEHVSSNQDCKHIKAMIDQPFCYLDRGKQMFAFASSDGKYVLKFFDTYRFNFKKNKNIVREMERAIAGYTLAYKQDRKHAGMFFFTSKSIPGADLKVVVSDRFGFKHQIDLGQVPFVIQQRAIPTREVITKLLNEGNVGEAKRHLSLIIEMYLDEYRRGLYDRDHNFMYNTGFVDGQPIRMDLGRLMREEAIKQPENYMGDLRKIAIERLGGWLGRHFPAYQETLVGEMEQLLKEISAGLH